MKERLKRIDLERSVKSLEDAVFGFEELPTMTTPVQTLAKIVNLNLCVNRLTPKTSRKKP